MALAENGKFGAMIDAMWPALVHPRHRGDSALKAAYIAMCHDVGPQAFMRQQQAIMGRVDSRPLLPTIRCPTLVLVGAQDELTPPHLSAEMAAAIPGARLVKVADCGHMSTMEQPAAVTAALMEWLAT
jgi:pimeloyl-ACP methyl ester carboxylesterase